MDTKIFVGKLNTIKTQYGEIITFAISPKDKEIINQYSNKRGWCNISIMTNPQGKKYAVVDTYGLEKEVKKEKSPEGVQTPDEINLDEIPF